MLPAGVFEAGCFPGCWYSLSVFFTSLEVRAVPPIVCVSVATNIACTLTNSECARAAGLCVRVRVVQHGAQQCAALEALEGCGVLGCFCRHFLSSLAYSSSAAQSKPCEQSVIRYS